MTARYSDQHTTTLSDKTSALYGGARLHVMYDTYTVVAEEQLTIDFPRLQAGKILILSHLSWVRGDDGDATADLHLGFRAYVDSTGTTVSEDDNYWLDNVDVGGGNIQGLIPAITGVTTAGARPVVLDAQDGLRLFVTVDTASANVGDVYTVCIVYAHIG